MKFFGKSGRALENALRSAFSEHSCRGFLAALLSVGNLYNVIATALNGGNGTRPTGSTETEENMKKFALAGLFAIAAIALSQQQASAWVNHRFSVGLNWHRQSANNNFIWGAFRNGQVPGPESFGGGMPYHQHHGMMPSFAPPAAQGFQAPMPQPTNSEPPIAGQYYSPYHYASYPRTTNYYYYYPAPAYYYYSYYGQ